MVGTSEGGGIRLRNGLDFLERSRTHRVDTLTPSSEHKAACETRECALLDVACTSGQLSLAGW